MLSHVSPAWQVLRKGFPEAADYLDRQDHSKTYLYAMLKAGHTTHGHNTSNIAEIINNVVKDARGDDPYNFNDFVTMWTGRKIHQRQEIGAKLQASKRLWTAYANEIIVKQEYLAREEDYTCTGQGENTFLIVRKSRRGREDRHTVDLNQKTCTCSAMACRRLPCAHVILVLDKLDLRNTPGKMLRFRRNWVAPYFWSENYVEAYRDVKVVCPPMDRSATLNLGLARRILSPLCSVKSKGRCKKKKTCREGSWWQTFTSKI